MVLVNFIIRATSSPATCMPRILQLVWQCKMEHDWSNVVVIWWIARKYIKCMYHRGSEVQSNSKQSLNTKKFEIIKSKYYNTQFWILHSSHDKCLSSRLYHHVWHTHMCVNHKSLTCSKLDNMTSHAKIKLPKMTNYNTQIVEKWVVNVKCFYYVYEIKHKRLSDIYIV